MGAAMDTGGRNRTASIDSIVFIPDRSGLERVLGPLEAVVMRWFWEHPTDGWRSIREIKQALDQEQPRAYSTYSTTVYRMQQKGLLDGRVREASHANAFEFRPAIDEERLYALVVRKVLDALTSDCEDLVGEYIKRRYGP